MTPSNLHFRWSPTHRDLEVISEDSMPVYLFAPDAFLGDQSLSYGQSLSFLLRLDRGVRRPSVSDVVLEGAGLRVAAPLGNLRTILPCGQKTTYTFRLTEDPSNKWQPQLTSLQFQKLLQNLTAIMIRGTFGENGRGYLDNVYLTSARRGPGVAAGWVESCSCPAGYEGQFCERCSQGYKRQSPADGPLSPCVPCKCRGGTCDPETGDCYSGDETPSGDVCSSGYYFDPAQRGCRRCPCPQGGTCSVTPGTLEVKCDRCAPGVTGPQCNLCDDGFYGDPLGEHGPQRPCRRCQCSGHMDPNAVGNCDHVTGECLKCLNHTRGFHCELCEEGFYHSHASDVCKSCNCNPMGSVSNTCGDSGQCSCKEGFEGLRCEKSSCPACFDQVKNKMERYLSKLREMESLLEGIRGGSVPVTDAQMERMLGEAEALVKSMRESSDVLSGTEALLQSRLKKINSAHVVGARDLQAVSYTVDSIKQQDQSYQRKVADTQLLIDAVRRKLETAKRDIREAEFPSGDEAAEGSSTFSHLALKATALADKHQKEAETVEQTAKGALAEAEKALVLMRSVITGENKVTELVNDLKTKFDRSSARVKALEGQATRLSSSAEEESRVAMDALRQIASLKKSIPGPLKTEMASVAAALKNLTGDVTGNLTEYDNILSYIQTERAELEDLLAKGLAAQQKPEMLLAKANAVKADAENSLKDIVANLDEVDEVLDKLKDFDKQISLNKAEAEEAIKRLPGINATIQQAVGSNSKTLLLLGNAEGDYSDALETVSKLDDALAGMQGAPDTLTASSNLLKDSTRFAEDLKGLQAQATATSEKLEAEKALAKQQNKMVKEAAAGAVGAHSNAKNAQEAVGETLKAINDLLSLLGQPGSVDEERLAKLEGSMVDFHGRVNGLASHLERLEEMEARQREQLSSMDTDISNILDDISNLEDIRKAIPTGCYNLGPIERP
ncbi:laminin subunit gamma-2 isoform X2 [Megalops cyprinoides]|nr:laminin subunit gamma-2 isoform X2 [Megalops cyprinoides]